jgi:hypothetical protein
MDEAQHYREEATELRKIANGSSDDIMRKRLLKNADSCEQMAVALDTIATAVCAHAKLTAGRDSDRPVIANGDFRDFWGRGF